MNFLALNVMHNIVTGKRTAEDARKHYAETATAFMMNPPAPCTEGLRFDIPHGGTADLDEVIGGCDGPPDGENVLGRTSAGELLPQNALAAIRRSHRVFALVVAVAGWAAARAFRVSKALGMAIALLLGIQFSLDVANVAFNVPLALAAAQCRRMGLPRLARRPASAT